MGFETHELGSQLNPILIRCTKSKPNLQKCWGG